MTAREFDAIGGRTSHGPVGLIRLIAGAVVREGDRLLAWDDHDPLSGEVVAVPLAGGIEFGETGEQAIMRELREEIGATVTSIQLLGVLEDVFRWAGQQRHEVWLIYDVALADRSVYDSPEVRVAEPDGTLYSARWRPLDAFRSSVRLVPEGLLELIARSGD